MYFQIQSGAYAPLTSSKNRSKIINICFKSTLTFHHHRWTKSPRGANRENGSGLSSSDWSRDRSLNHPFLLQISPDRHGLECNRPRPVAAAGWIAGPTLCHGSQLAVNTTIWMHKQWHDIDMGVQNLYIYIVFSSNNRVDVSWKAKRRTVGA